MSAQFHRGAPHKAYQAARSEPRAPRQQQRIPRGWYASNDAAYLEMASRINEVISSTNRVAVAASIASGLLKKGADRQFPDVGNLFSLLSKLTHEYDELLALLEASHHECTRARDMMYERPLADCAPRRPAPQPATRGPVARYPTGPPERSGPQHHQHNGHAPRPARASLDNPAPAARGPAPIRYPPPAPKRTADAAQIEPRREKQRPSAPAAPHTTFSAQPEKWKRDSDDDENDLETRTIYDTDDENAWTSSPDRAPSDDTAAHAPADTAAYAPTNSNTPTDTTLHATNNTARGPHEPTDTSARAAHEPVDATVSYNLNASFDDSPDEDDAESYI